MPNAWRLPAECSFRGGYLGICSNRPTVASVAKRPPRWRRAPDRSEAGVRFQAAVASGRKLHVARTTGKSPEIRKWIIPGVVSFPSHPGAER